MKTVLIASIALLEVSGLETQSTDDEKFEAAVEAGVAAAEMKEAQKSEKTDSAAEEVAKMIARNPPKEIEAIDWEKQEALLAKLSTNPPHLSKARLPKGYKIGRCLLVVDGKTRISGSCAYIIYKGGNFHIDGPRQVFGGIDYPDPKGSSIFTLTTDFWANVSKDEEGKWTGYGNEVASYSKGEGSAWYELVKNGACYSNETKRQPSDTYQQLVKVCLWKK